MTKEQATREALELALEALEYPLNTSHKGFNVDMAELLSHRAITAIKEALAVDNQQLTTEALQSNEQVEPVVWMYQNKSTHEVRFQKHMRSFVDHGAWYEVPLYSEPLANQEKTSGSPKPVKPEALRLADAMEYDLDWCDEAAAELRRMHDLLGKANALCRVRAEEIERLKAQPEQERNLKLMPREATREMLEAMDECSMEGYDERLYAGHAASVYMAAWDAFHGQHCYCGDITTLGVIHRNDGPCHYPEHTTEYKRGYADAMNWKVQNHLEHLPTAQPEQELTNLERHERNVQQLFGTPQPKEPIIKSYLEKDNSQPEQEPPVVAELLCVCGAEWEWRNRDWELVSTPPQRTAAVGEDTRRAWVGLTDDDAQDVIMKAMHSITGGENTFRLSANMIWVAVVKEVEAKLREKNNGA